MSEQTSLLASTLANHESRLVSLDIEPIAAVVDALELGRHVDLLNQLIEAERLYLTNLVQEARRNYLAALNAVLINDVAPQT